MRLFVNLDLVKIWASRVLPPELAAPLCYNCPEPQFPPLPSEENGDPQLKAGWIKWAHRDGPRRSDTM